MQIIRVSINGLPDKDWCDAREITASLNSIKGLLCPIASSISRNCYDTCDMPASMHCDQVYHSEGGNGQHILLF